MLIGTNYTSTGEPIEIGFHIFRSLIKSIKRNEALKQDQEDTIV